MANIFSDQSKFMKACGQTVGKVNQEQKQLYLKLIEEEFQELKDATTLVDELDALIDILVVTAGALHSGGYDVEGAWKEVMNSNFAKIDPHSGRVRRREDGKILKPDGWKPPKLIDYIPKQ